MGRQFQITKSYHIGSKLQPSGSADELWNNWNTNVKDAKSHFMSYKKYRSGGFLWS